MLMSKPWLEITKQQELPAVTPEDLIFLFICSLGEEWKSFYKVALSHSTGILYEADGYISFSVRQNYSLEIPCSILLWRNSVRDRLLLFMSMQNQCYFFRGACAKWSIKLIYLQSLWSLLIPLYTHPCMPFLMLEYVKINKEILWTIQISGRM